MSKNIYNSLYKDNLLRWRSICQGLETYGRTYRQTDKVNPDPILKSGSATLCDTVPGIWWEGSRMRERRSDT